MRLSGQWYGIRFNNEWSFASRQRRLQFTRLSFPDNRVCVTRTTSERFWMNIVRFQSILAVCLLAIFSGTANSTVYTGSFKTTQYSIGAPSLGTEYERLPASAFGSLTGTITTDGTIGSVNAGPNGHITAFSLTAVNPVYVRTNSSIPPPSPNVELTWRSVLHYCDISVMPPAAAAEGCASMFWFLAGSLSGVATPDSLILSAGLNNLGRDGLLFVDPNTQGRWSSGGGTSYFDGPMVFTAVPTPATIALLSLGLVGFGAVRRKQA
jgi:hypothetical protein